MIETETAKWIYLLYGMEIMYFALMAWLFWFRSRGRVKKMLAVLMAIFVVQYAKDLPLIDTFCQLPGGAVSRLTGCTDFVAVPVYGFILAELCRPGWLKARTMAWTELPFLLLPALYAVLRQEWIYYSLTALAAAYGVACFCWMWHELPRYHQRLKDEYSYDEDINLHWLRGVTALYFFILLLWLADCVQPSAYTILAYLALSLAGWMAVCRFIYKQELVISTVRGSSDSADCTELETGNDEAQTAEASPTAAALAPEASAEETFSQIEKRLQKLLDEEKVYLEPKLRLLDLARRLGTNRTYLSRYFNTRLHTTFYDFVNNYRLAHAQTLLQETDYPLESVASLSGFNSLSTFRRAFAAAHNGESPQKFRLRTCQAAE